MKATRAPTVHEAMVDPQILGRWFAGPSHATWRVVAKALDGLPLDAVERRIFDGIAGGRSAPTRPVSELWVVKGRRSGGTLFEGGLAAHSAAFFGGQGSLGPGEVAHLGIITTDRRQSRVALRYASGMVAESPLLRPKITSQNAEGIGLDTRTLIEVTTCSFRSIRGYSLALACCDETAFWMSEETSSNPDTEVLAALRPALANLGGRLIVVSSPYARRGVLWDTYARRFGRDDPDVLVLQGGTRTFNPTIKQTLIDAALEEDEPRGRSEWCGEFRSDLEAFVSRDVVIGATDVGVVERPRPAGVPMVAAGDLSGGRSDSSVLAIGHRQGDHAVLDLLREWKPPHSPEAVIGEMAGILRGYGVQTIVLDRYGAEFPVDMFRQQGIVVRHAERTRSQVYAEALGLLNSGRIRLLDVPRLANQLIALERRTGRGSGKDVIDHPPGQHDDVANAAMLCAVEILGVGALVPRISILGPDGWE